MPHSQSRNFDALRFMMTHSDEAVLCFRTWPQRCTPKTTLALNSDEDNNRIEIKLSWNKIASGTASMYLHIFITIFSIYFQSHPAMSSLFHCVRLSLGWNNKWHGCIGRAAEGWMYKFLAWLSTIMQASLLVFGVFLSLSLEFQQFLDGKSASHPDKACTSKSKWLW